MMMVPDLFYEPAKSRPWRSVTINHPEILLIQQTISLHKQMR